MMDITLLGPQSSAPQVRSALDAIGLGPGSGPGTGGRLCSITAGLQEREGEIDELREHVGRPVHDLALYARCEAAFAEDPELFAAHRERQDSLIAMQRLYRVRLSHALAAVRELGHAQDPAAPLDAHRRAAISALRSLDRFHLRQINRAHAGFRAASPALERHRQAIARELEGCDAVLIAGGHVAVLVGRLRLFDLASLLADRAIVAWSAGAMALTERVVLFHDHPPQGAGDPEVLDAGLGLVPGLVLLPDAQRRLALDDAVRVATFARRFAPARALTLECGSMLRLGDEGVRAARQVRRLTNAGRVVDVAAP